VDSLSLARYGGDSVRLIRNENQGFLPAVKACKVLRRKTLKKKKKKNIKNKLTEVVHTYVLLEF
jgi:hypothetical protein